MKLGRIECFLFVVLFVAALCCGQDQSAQDQTAQSVRTIEHAKPILFIVTSPQCGPCNRLKELIPTMVNGNELQDFCVLYADTKKNPDLAHALIGPVDGPTPQLFLYAPKAYGFGALSREQLRVLLSLDAASEAARKGGDPTTYSLPAPHD